MMRHPRFLASLYSLGCLLALTPVLPVAAEPDTQAASVAHLTLHDDAVVPLSLGDAITRAQERHPTLAALAAQIRAAEADVRAARAAYWFQLEAQYTGRETQTFPDPEIPEGGEDLADSFSQADWLNSVDLNLTQPLPVFGQQRLGVKAAKLALQQAQLAYDLEVQRLREQVVTAFAQTLLTRQVLALRTAEVERQQLTYGQAQAKYDAGAVPQFEVLRANVALLNARDAQLQAQRTAAVAMLRFRQLVGSDSPVLPDAMPDFSAAWYRDPGLDLAWVAAAAKDYAFAHRPELRQLALSESQVSVATSLTKERPSLGVVGNLQFTDQDSAFAGPNSHSVILQLNVPLWDGGRDEAENAAGDARREALASEAAALRDAIAVEVMNAVMTLQEAVLRLETAEQTLSQAREALRIAELGYNEGVLVFLDLQEARDGLLAAELNALEATAGQVIAEATLLRALGLSDPDLALEELESRQRDMEGSGSPTPPPG